MDDNKSIVNASALNAELLVIESRLDYLLKDGKKNGAVRFELAKAVKDLKKQISKIIPMIQSKFDFATVEKFIEISEDIEDINNVFMFASREEREEVINSLEKKLLERYSKPQ
jgi:predicted secreted protein